MKQVVTITEELKDRIEIYNDGELYENTKKNLADLFAWLISCRGCFATSTNGSKELWNLMLDMLAELHEIIELFHKENEK